MDERRVGVEGAFNGATVWRGSIIEIHVDRD